MSGSVERVSNVSTQLVFHTFHIAQHVQHLCDKHDILYVVEFKTESVHGSLRNTEEDCCERNADTKERKEEEEEEEEEDTSNLKKERK